MAKRVIVLWFYVLLELQVPTVLPVSSPSTDVTDSSRTVLTSSEPSKDFNFTASNNPFETRTTLPLSTDSVLIKPTSAERPTISDSTTLRWDLNLSREPDDVNKTTLETEHDNFITTKPINVSSLPTTVTNHDDKTTTVNLVYGTVTIAAAIFILILLIVIQCRVKRRTKNEKVCDKSDPATPDDINQLAFVNLTYRTNDVDKYPIAIKSNVNVNSDANSSDDTVYFSTRTQRVTVRAEGDDKSEYDYLRSKRPVYRDPTYSHTSQILKESIYSRTRSQYQTHESNFTDAVYGNLNYEHTQTGTDSKHDKITIGNRRSKMTVELQNDSETTYANLNNNN